MIGLLKMYSSNAFATCECAELSPIPLCELNSDSNTALLDLLQGPGWSDAAIPTLRPRRFCKTPKFCETTVLPSGFTSGREPA